MQSLFLYFCRYIKGTTTFCHEIDGALLPIRAGVEEICEMTGDGLNAQGAKKKNNGGRKPVVVEDEPRPFTMNLFRSGEWLPPEE
jgi:hypothetical protein